MGCDKQKWWYNGYIMGIKKTCSGIFVENWLIYPLVIKDGLLETSHLV